MILASISTWPAEILNLLQGNTDTLFASAEYERVTMDEYLHPKATHVPRAHLPSNPYSSKCGRIAVELEDLLKHHEFLGWHCTRLIPSEITEIKSNGMSLPNREVLLRRILSLQVAGLIPENIAKRLREENEASDEYRQGIIWFCFFEPSLAGQSGIEQFFRHWGGEALYCRHERDPESGAVLKGIGQPCLVEANVSVSSISRNSLGQKIVNQYLKSKGMKTEPTLHEDRASKPISAKSICRVILHGEPEFERLTACDRWDPPL